MPDTAVVVMARYPSKGQTKTRLARSIGDEATLRLYRAFLADLAHHLAGPPLEVLRPTEETRRGVGLPRPSMGLPRSSVGLPRSSVGLPRSSVGLPRSHDRAFSQRAGQAHAPTASDQFPSEGWRTTFDLFWTYTPPDVDYDAFIAELCPTLARYTRSFPQEGADLGARLHHAFTWTTNFGYKKTIIIGSDSPHIRRAMITDAQDALDEADVALGPADDGGYYLIAMRQPHDVFSGIPMSTNVVMDMTIAAAQRLNLTVSLIEPLFDVDELPDLLRLAQLLREDAARAPRTAALLADMNLSVHRAR